MTLAHSEHFIGLNPPLIGSDNQYVSLNLFGPFTCLSVNHCFLLGKRMVGIDIQMLVSYLLRIPSGVADLIQCLILQCIKSSTYLLEIKVVIEN